MTDEEFSKHVEDFKSTFRNDSKEVEVDVPMNDVDIIMQNTETSNIDSLPAKLKDPNLLK